MKNLSRFELNEEGKIIDSNLNASKMSLFEYMKFIIVARKFFIHGIPEIIEDIRYDSVELFKAFLSFIINISALLCNTILYPVAMPILITIAWAINKHNHKDNNDKIKTGTIK